MPITELENDSESVWVKVFSKKTSHFVANKIQKLSSFKSNENIHKKEDGPYYVVSANKVSSVTL